MASHKFEPSTFRTPSYCGVCEKFIWGLKAKNGLRCTVCFTCAHQKCAEKAPKDCIETDPMAELVPEEIVEDAAWMNIEKQNILDYYSAGSPYDFYEKTGKLGEGGGGAVYSVKSKKDGARWALKEIRKDSYDLPLLEREILVMKELNHEGLVQMKEAYHDKTYIFLVLEVVDGGELFDRIIEQENFSEHDAADITAQLLRALDFMHSKGCAHRDIKAENVLCTDKKGTTVKLADFGLANALGEQSRFASCVGTTDYMAPELLEGVRYSMGVDVWSQGVLTYIMLSGYPPFYGKTENDKVERILSARFDFNHSVWDNVSDSAKNFICRMLVLQPKKRWSVKMLLQHPWITGHAREGVAKEEGMVLKPLGSERLKDYVQEIQSSRRDEKKIAEAGEAVESAKKKKKKKKDKKKKEKD